MIFEQIESTIDSSKIEDLKELYRLQSVYETKERFASGQRCCYEATLLKLKYLSDENLSPLTVLIELSKFLQIQHGEKVIDSEQWRDRERDIKSKIKELEDTGL